MGLFERGMRSLPAFEQLCADIRAERTPVSLTGLGHIHKVLFVHTLCGALSRRAVMLVADEAEAMKVVDDLTALGAGALAAAGGIRLAGIRADAAGGAGQNARRGV